MLESLGGFITGLFSAVPQAVTTWIEGRNAVRVEHLRNQFDIDAQERSVRTARRIREIELEFSLLESYPLGVPGRLGKLLPPSAGPTLLVSPAPPWCPIPLDGVAERTVELLSRQHGLSRYAAVPTGAFVRDGGVPRYIDGEVGARTVAEADFATAPAVLVYFVAGGSGVTAEAYLSTVFGDTSGSTGFSYPIARYADGGPDPVITRDSHLASWHQVNLGRFPDSAPVEVVASTVAWFLLSVVDAYWQLTTGAVPGLLAASEAVTVVGVGQNRTASGSPLAIAEREAVRLSDLGYAVSAETLPDDRVGLALSGAHQIAIVIDKTYPGAPPVAVRVDGADIDIDAAGWTPECTLADIVEAFR